MTALGASPWVDFTGFYASSVSTVADPKAPVPTRSIYFDFYYFNYILSDMEADAHRARGDAVLSTLSPRFHNQDCALLMCDNEYRHEGLLVDWAEWNEGECCAHHVCVCACFAFRSSQSCAQRAMRHAWRVCGVFGIA